MDGGSVRVRPRHLPYQCPRCVLLISCRPLRVRILGLGHRSAHEAENGLGLVAGADEALGS